MWILHKNWKGTTQTNNIECQYIFDAHASSATATGNDIFKPGFVTAIDYNYTSNTENLLVFDVYQTHPIRYYEAKTQSHSLSDQWQFITMQRVGSNYEMYVNGTLVSLTKDTLSSDPTNELQNMMHNLFIGIFAGNNSEYYFKGCNFSGKIDDINFYTRALSPCEIKKLYSSKTSRIKKNTILGFVFIKNECLYNKSSTIF